MVLDAVTASAGEKRRDSESSTVTALSSDTQRILPLALPREFLFLDSVGRKLRRSHVRQPA
jgi:hypothetical protein